MYLQNRELDRENNIAILLSINKLYSSFSVNFKIIIFLKKFFVLKNRVHK